MWLRLTNNYSSEFDTYECDTNYHGENTGNEETYSESDEDVDESVIAYLKEYTKRNMNLTKSLHLNTFSRIS